MKRIVFFTGAGMSRESGLPTFRGDGGLWDQLDVEAIADRRSWYCGRRSDCNERRQKMLDFFNPIRRLILEKGPNEGHRLIAGLEKYFQITVITQNGDDYHERAGSTDVIYLHGEALKNASTANPHYWYDINRMNPDIHIGDKAPDGSQLRPYVIYFGEDIERPIWVRAVEATKSADIFVVVGSTMLVFPAADLLKMIPANCRLYIIDPQELHLPDSCHHEFEHIRLGASEGIKLLAEQLDDRLNDSLNPIEENKYQY